MSYETRYAAMMDARRERLSNTPEAAVARLRLQQAMNNAREDVRARYPEITKENFSDAILYQQERIDFWRSKTGA